jgi:hypothetical protein
MQHWYELQARAEIALYEGSLDEHADWVLERLGRITRSLVYRTQAMRFNADSVAARVHLALAPTRPGSLRVAHRLIRRLRGEGVAHVAVWADTFEAAMMVQQGHRDRARELLARTIRDADALQLDYYGAVARLRCLELTEDPADSSRLRAEVEAWAAREGVVDMHRMARVIAPA